MHREEEVAFAADRGRGTRPVTVKRRALGVCVLEEVLCKEQRHLSLHFPSVFEQFTEENGGTVEALARVLSEESGRLIGGLAGARVLFVGLGNPQAAVDALAPHAAARIRPTANLPHSLCKKVGCSLLSVFCPSVAAQTGIESATLVKAAVEASQAALVVVADAMATRATARLGTTVEVSTRGIVPGSGVGGGGTRLDCTFLGVPVLSLGFPIVLDATSLSVGDGEQDGIFDYLSPREGEAAASRLSRILAQAVERVFGIPTLF